MIYLEIINFMIFALFTGEITMIYAYAVNLIIICAIVLSIGTEKDSVKSYVIDSRK